MNRFGGNTELNFFFKLYHYGWIWNFNTEQIITFALMYGLYQKAALVSRAADSWTNPLHQLNRSLKKQALFRACGLLALWCSVSTSCVAESDCLSVPETVLSHHRVISQQSQETDCMDGPLLASVWGVCQGPLLQEWVKPCVLLHVSFAGKVVGGGGVFQWIFYFQSGLQEKLQIPRWICQAISENGWKDISLFLRFWPRL